MSNAPKTPEELVNLFRDPKAFDEWFNSLDDEEKRRVEAVIRRHEAPNPAIIYTVTDKTWNVRTAVTPPVHLFELAKQQLEILRADGHENLVVTASECLLEEHIEERRTGFPAALEAEHAWLAMDPLDQILWCRDHIRIAQLQTFTWASEKGVAIRRVAS